MNSTHRFVEDKSAFGNLPASYEERISSVDKGTAVHVVYFGFQNICGHSLLQNACSQIQRTGIAG